MIDHIYLTGQVKALSPQSTPISVTIIAEFLKKTISRHKTDSEIEIINISNHCDTHFNISGSVRLEILFYEKQSPEEGREQITLYGVAENNRFQLKSFTLFYDTCWFDKTIHYPDDRYFDSILIQGYPVETIPSSSLNVMIRDSAGIVVAKSTAKLRFDLELKEQTAPHIEVNPFHSVPGNTAMSSKSERMREPDTCADTGFF